MNTYSGRLMSLGGLVLLAARRSSHSERLLCAAYFVALLVADILMVGLAFRLGFWVRFGLKLTTSPEIVPSLAFYTAASFMIIAICIPLFGLSGLYSWGNLLGGTTEYSRASNAVTMAVLVAAIATFVFPALTISRVWLLFSWPMAAFLVSAARFSLRRVVYALRQKGFFMVRAAVVGMNGEAVALARALRDPGTGYQIMGLIASDRDTDREAQNEYGFPVLGHLDDLERVVHELGITELVVSGASLHREELVGLYERVHQSEGLQLRMSTGLFELLTTGVEVKTAGVVPLIGMRRMRLDTSELILKTACEYGLTILGLIVLLPFLGLIALAIRLDSRGPVFHRRRVLGVGGKEFYAFKFRSMHVDGDRILERHPELAERLKTDQKLKDDPRITRVGRLLRKFSLDELPQLFNVLLGQMSLVGPRMISPPEADLYGRQKYNLLSVKPGITGLWQVSGRSDLSYNDRIKLDMYYVRNYSIWLDLHLLFVKTANAVLRGRGAY